jgi:tetratricopeptide (TPR) repeat protein
MAIHRNNTSGTPGDKAETLRMLAFLNQDEGNYKKAENLLQEAIETFKQTRDGPVNDDVAISLTRLGNLKWFNQGNFKAADSLLNKALVLEQEIHSDNHLHIANVNNDLAAMTHGRGLLTEAKPYYQAAIAEYRNLAGNHANLAIILSNYSALLLDMGDYTEAKNIQQEALQMHRKQTGEESIDVALGIGRLGKIALNQGNYQKADSLLNLSLNKTKNIYGKSHPYIARLHLDLGRLAMHRQKYQSAGNLMQQAHSEYQKVYPKKHPRQSDPLLRLGLLHSNLDNLDEAKSYFTKSLDIRKASYPIESWHVAEAQAFYGNYLLRTEEYEKAEKMLAKSYDNALRIRGKDDTFVKEIRRNLGKTDMTEKYKQP